MSGASGVTPIALLWLLYCCIKDLLMVSAKEIEAEETLLSWSGRNQKMGVLS